MLFRSAILSLGGKTLTIRANGVDGRPVQDFTAKCINRLEARQGAVWAKDSFNRNIRNDQEYRFQRDYVRKNPIRAGLKGWKWVSEE